MDHRKFNKPIILEIYWLNEKEKGFTDYWDLKTAEKYLEIEKDNREQLWGYWIEKIIPDRRLSRSSYYRLLHLVDGKKALIEEPSSYTWDK